MRKTKIRLDEMLVNSDLAADISAAQAIIRAGTVLVNDKLSDKPGSLIRIDDKVRVRERRQFPWVSRAGEKLAYALKEFGWSPDSQVVVDLGACTGGFTEVMLCHGAKRVYAVDVGYGELAWKLRQDPRVVVMERTNARHLTKDQFSQLPNWIVCDASFIKLSSILPAALELVSGSIHVIVLIKPQFEVAAHEVGEGGIVRDPILHERVCAEISSWFLEQGFSLLPIIESPILGTEGNKEFLLGAFRDN
jgi:23S rRNA (cytidine1920-2'-O)/16S rRNA (cytidine1409-2'-O)-methyltransferase